MPKLDDRRYFIIKHDLDSLTKLPNFVWRTNQGPSSVPHRFTQVKKGDRWVAFAYTSGDVNERPLSMVTGFYECTEEASFRHVPKGLPLSEYKWKKKGYAWMIEGNRCWERPCHPVGVPPIADLLDKPMWHNQGIIPISAEDFEIIRSYTFSHEFDSDDIPLLRRQPHNEQELLSAVIFGHEKLGIKEIVQVQKAFPDLLVKIDGYSKEVYLELEVYSHSFISHGHYKQVRKGKFKDDDTPVAVLCWVDNDEKVKQYVHRVYELQCLIREKKQICW